MSEFTTEPTTSNESNYKTDDNNQNTPAIKVEAAQELPNFEQQQQQSKEWDAGMELALLNAISRCKPVGKSCLFLICAGSSQQKH